VPGWSRRARRPPHGPPSPRWPPSPPHRWGSTSMMRSMSMLAANALPDLARSRPGAPGSTARGGRGTRGRLRGGRWLGPDPATPFARGGPLPQCERCEGLGRALEPTPPAPSPADAARLRPPHRPFPHLAIDDLTHPARRGAARGRAAVRAAGMAAGDGESGSGQRATRRCRHSPPSHAPGPRQRRRPPARPSTRRRRGREPPPPCAPRRARPAARARPLAAVRRRSRVSVGACRGPAVAF
jgi:hypothetical protein